MKEQTIYVSEDGRRFDSAENCQEWEALLVVVRRVRQKLWEARVKYLREENHVGEQWLQRHYGTECTDDCDLGIEGPDEALDELNVVFGGRLENVSNDEVQQYIEKVKRQHSIIFEP